MRVCTEDNTDKMKRIHPGDRVFLFLSLIFFRQCALAALKDVHNYLSHEEGHVAVKKFPFFFFPGDAEMENS